MFLDQCYNVVIIATFSYSGVLGVESWPGCFLTRCVFLMFLSTSRQIVE